MIGSLALISIAMAQNPLPNPGFENWETIGAYEEPIDWSSANECSDQISLYAVGKSTDAHSGSFSVRMVTLDLLGTVKINGVVTTSDMICTPPYGISGGITYDQRPDSIAGWYKYTAVDLDTGYVQAILFNGADTIGYAKAATWGTTSIWSRFSEAIDYTSTATPTLSSVLFNSSWGNGNLNQGFAGSELLIDDVEFIFNPNGIGDHPTAAQWEVYPNPTDGVLHVEFAAGEDAFLTLLDVAGKQVAFERVGETASELDLSALEPGLYVYRLMSLENRVIRTGKLLVNP